MPQENEARAGKPSDFIDDFFQDQDEPAPPGETDEGLEPGVNTDAEAVTVSLQKVAHGGEDCVEIYAHGEAYPKDHREKTQQRVLLARVTERALTMFPLVSASYRPAFLAPKYDELTTITILAEEDEPWWLPEDIREFDGMLESLPTGFGRHAKYGLGFKWEYRLIPQAIQEMGGITELVIEAGRGASAEPPKFRLGIDRFTAIKRSIDSITTRARARSLNERRLLAFNELLHVADPARFERRYPKVKPGEIYELIQMRSRAPNRSAKDGIAAAQVVQEDAQKIASEEPSKLFELKAVIEQVTLAQLIGEFEAMLQKNLPEPKWQAFFKANPFILGLAFPYPVYRGFPVNQPARYWLLSIRTFAVFPSRPEFGFDAAPQRTDCTSTGGLVALVVGAGPDTNRSAGLHSFAAVATMGAAQG